MSYINPVVDAPLPQTNSPDFMDAGEFWVLNAISESKQECYVQRLREVNEETKAEREAEARRRFEELDLPALDEKEKWVKEYWKRRRENQEGWFREHEVRCMKIKKDDRKWKEEYWKWKEEEEAREMQERLERMRIEQETREGNTENAEKKKGSLWKRGQRHLGLEQLIERLKNNASDRGES